ncbi:hypothetical protein BDV06DRAFT_208356 [Aspergillus oleicola]
MEIPREAREERNDDLCPQEVVGGISSFGSRPRTGEPISSRKRGRKNGHVACHFCRKQKIRCSGGNSNKRCDACNKRDQECQFGHVRDEREVQINRQSVQIRELQAKLKQLQRKSMNTGYDYNPPSSGYPSPTDTTPPGLQYPSLSAQDTSLLSDMASNPVLPIPEFNNFLASQGAYRLQVYQQPQSPAPPSALELQYSGPGSNVIPAQVLTPHMGQNPDVYLAHEQQSQSHAGDEEPKASARTLAL